MKAVFYDPYTNMRIGTYLTKTVLTKDEAQLEVHSVISELLVGGWHCVTGFTPTKNTLKVAKINPVFFGKTNIYPEKIK